MSGPVQLTSLVRNLNDLGAMLNPVKLVSVVAGVVNEIKEPPPGDPDALEALAAAYRAAGASLTPLGSQVAALGTEPLPATGRVLDRVAATLTATGDTLADLATSVREHQRRHTELHQALAAAAHDATHVGSVPMPDPVGIAQLVGVVGDLISGCVAVYTDALTAADRAAGRLNDLRGAARAAAAVEGGLSPRDAVALADIGLESARFDPGLFGLSQLARLGAAKSAEVAELLASASAEAERAWLFKAVGAGHGVEVLRGFAEAIRGRDETWLRSHLSLVDRGDEAAQSRMGVAVRQYEATTCGTTVLIVARAEHDPVYALALTRDDFQPAFAAERAVVHKQTNVVYPRAVGTSPKGVAAYLTRHLGTRYDWRLVDDTDRREISRTLREVLAAVDQGLPVPLLVGGIVPRHYVLVVAHERGVLLVFEPTAGRTVAVPEQAFLDGDLKSALGFDHVQSAILPRVPTSRP
ncbi:hypothetical protein [Actinokineospora xionganensis]|uniref:Uncharacterized protein n=1 Tax=Actinokineospora xionganensis TaxID=2684470 RepID=A0ABR7LB60_9PSEU|nr:hypothetical protein [Actinokineospora xionganensis]MBC6449738.1 hypothetical protein [Actinokineospora xionganensis]